MIEPLKILGTDLVFSQSPGMGLTKREYFAAKAMQGLLSNQKLFETMAETCKGLPDITAGAITNMAASYADAQIAALNAAPGSGAELNKK